MPGHAYASNLISHFHLMQRRFFSQVYLDGYLLPCARCGESRINAMTLEYVIAFAATGGEEVK